TDNCSLKNVTEEMGTSSNDELSVNAAGGNRRLSEDVSLPGRTMSDQNSVAQTSSVCGLKAEYVGVTSVNLNLMVNVTATDSYTYRTKLRNSASIRYKMLSITKTKITRLIPGAL
ncbi:hypothetical protein CIB84_015538, partial [Bambusicola thoracicus]